MQKILIGLVLVALVVIVTLGFQLRSAHSDVATLTLAVGTAQQEASNARSAQQTAEGQSRQWASRFDSLDASLKLLGVNQQANSEALQKKLTVIANIQKTEGDTNETISCLDLPVPVQLDLGLRDDSASAHGGH